MWYVLTFLGIIICAVQAVRSKRLLASAIWLAGTSAFVSILLALLGTYQIAVIELSVGAGLVTVLFVFAINIAGEEPLEPFTLIPKPLAWLLVVLAVIIILYQLLPIFNIPIFTSQSSLFQQVLWQDRKVDLYLQIVFIFSGVLSMLGLLSEQKNEIEFDNVEEVE